MDLFIIIIVVAMILLVMVVVATLHVQQTAQLRDIQTRLTKMDEVKVEPKSSETLRLERTQWLDPLSQLEPQLHAQNRSSLTEEELAQVAAAREGVKAICEALKAKDEWLGPPFDLEWTDYLDRLPRIKALYMRADLQPDPQLPPPVVI